MSYYKGVLRAKVVLDREEQDSYTLVIQASDNPSPNTSIHHQNQLTDSLIVRISVADENDNKPECEQDAYRLEVSQNAEVGTVLTQVKGVDYDLGRNSQLRYFINGVGRDSTSDLINLSK